MKVAHNLKGDENLVAFMPTSGDMDSMEGYLDDDRACDDNDQRRQAEATSWLGEEVLAAQPQPSSTATLPSGGGSKS